MKPHWIALAVGAGIGAFLGWHMGTRAKGGGPFDFKVVQKRRMPQ